ncbi:MAG: hypothetical protein J6K29_10475 [Clostridia bacterium]|nr:hypothetical protein [Clostridia bacterium]
MKRKINITVTALFLALIFGFGTAFWIVPDLTFSPEENRSLQTFPDLTAENWLDGKISAQLIDYYSDQFPLRHMWVGLHAVGELGALRGECNGVLVGKNGQLAVRRFDAYLSRFERLENTDYYSPAHVEKGLNALIALDETLSAQRIPLCVLLAPRTIDVTIGDFAYPSDISDGLDETIRTTLSGAHVNSVELLSTFRELHQAGEYVYYRTDHHWTTQGAYTAYTAVMESWGMQDQILPAEAFAVKQIPAFYGTTHARAGLAFIPPDTLEIWEAADDSRYTVLERKGDELRAVIESGFISEKYLTEKDKYSAFLDGTHDLLFILDKEAAAQGESRPRLLLAKDSFANSMVPFLARHFDILMVNLTGNTDYTHLSALCEEYACGRVLVVCNRENLITSDCLTRLH